MSGDVKPLILASQSAGRQELLRAAGITFESVPAYIDELSVKEGLLAEGAKPRDIADTLAEAKALKISRKYPGALVLGSDQVLAAPDGSLMSKAETPEQAEVHIAKLSGRKHRLISAAVICEAGKPVWRIVDTAALTMKALSADEIIAYVSAHWDNIRHCTGCYRIEAEGRALFEDIAGDESTIVGMPISPLLAYLEMRGILPS